MVKPIFIYTLNCPITEQPRYLGKTDFPDRRLRVHLSAASTEQTHKGKWLRSLFKRGLKPVMEILDVVPDNEADFWEREYIQMYREAKSRLTNETDGGDGFRSGEKHPLFGVYGPAHPRFGKKRSTESRAKQSATNAQNPNSGTFKPGLTPWNKGLAGQKLSKEICLKMSEAKKGIPWTKARRDAEETKKSYGK